MVEVVGKAETKTPGCVRSGEKLREHPARARNWRKQKLSRWPMSTLSTSVGTNEMRSRPSLAVAVKLAKVLGVEVNELLKSE